MHNKYHLFDVHRACASYSMRHMYIYFFLFFFFLYFFSLFLFISLFFFTCLFLVPTTIQDNYMRQRSQRSFRIYKVSNVHSPSNHKRNQSQQVFVARKDSGVHKGMQVGKSRGMLYLSSTSFTLYCWLPPCSRNLDGVDSMNNADDDVVLLLLFETS